MQETTVSLTCNRVSEYGFEDVTITAFAAFQHRCHSLHPRIGELREGIMKICKKVFFKKKTHVF